MEIFRTQSKTYNFSFFFTKLYAGFNCCEAVNFAVGDWFPWGAMAGHEYANLCKMVILPYEELLCKEAMILSKSSDHPSYHLPSQTCVKTFFVRRIKFLNNALWNLKKNLNASFKYSPKFQGTIVCQLCKRDSYLAFLECDACFHHSCIFHGKYLPCNFNPFFL